MSLDVFLRLVDYVTMELESRTGRLEQRQDSQS